jgi:hypothetical protein
MSAGRVIATVIFSIACSSVTHAQTVDPVHCETQANTRKAAWATTEHSWFETMLELQARGIELSLCRMHAATGQEKLHHAEDFGRIFLTGEGIHPVVATIAPGNGLAAGAAMTHEWASADRPLRYRGDAHARVSINGSWTAGGLVNIVGSSPSQSNRHQRAIVDGSYTHVAEVSFFGLGPSSPNDETRFGLNLGIGRFTFIVPAGSAFEVFGQVAGLRATPLAAPSGVPSIETRFDTTSAPGLGQVTAYAVFGGGAGFRYPEDEVLNGYSTDASIALRRYQEAGGRPYSFTRTDVRWNNQYTPDTSADLGTLSINVRLASAVAGSADQVPFYLMPTLGGADINGESGLRSYHDYRFRASHALAGEIEYAHVLFDPIGVFAFYDAGTVADRFGDLGRQVKHSVGVGATLRLGGIVFAQLYYAFGGNEGSRFNFTGNTNPSVVDNAARSAF